MICFKHSLVNIQVADELLGDVDAARGMAIDAVNMGNNVVKNAQETKKTLDGNH